MSKRDALEFYVYRSITPPSAGNLRDLHAQGWEVLSLVAWKDQFLTYVWRPLP